MSHNGFGDGGELIRQAKQHGGTVRTNGKHFVVCGPRGSVAIPNREIGKGLFCKIKKQLVLIGLAALLCACAAVSYLTQAALAAR